VKGSVTPKVSICIPVYNQRAFIARAVRSALAQELDGLGILVVDNQSDDGTWEALQPFAAEGVRLHRNPANLGLFGNFNRCIELADDAPYLRLLSGDDALAPGCLRAEVAAMERNPGLAMLSTRGRFVTPEGATLGECAAEFSAGIYAGADFPLAWFRYYASTRRNPLNYPSGVLFRRAAIGGQRFEEGWRTAGDIDFYFKLLRRGDLGIAELIGCDITRHAEQAHVGPNLDGTAMREQLALLDRYVEPQLQPPLRRGLAGMCLALAAMHGGASARAHWRLAREIASLPAALCGLAALVLGRMVARPPQPQRALA
jgi:glycosyltransferase involved in cell wall biosynthesis